MGSCIGRNSEVQINTIVPKKNFGENNALLDKWSGQQVKLLSKKFNEYKTTEGLDFEGFEKLFKDSSYIPKAAILNIFNQFALSEFRVINFRSFCVLVAQIFLSSKREKAELIFKFFDSNNDGIWTIEEKQVFCSSYRDYVKNSKKKIDIQFNFEPTLIDFVGWCVKYLDFTFILKPFDILPSPEREKMIIYEMLEQIRFTEGSIGYLLTCQWWETWKNYVSYGKSADLSLTMNKSIAIGDRPVAIDNSALLAEDSELKLKVNLKNDKDFILVSQKIWDILQEWYGGGPIITRSFICKNKKIMLELYPPILSIIPIQNNGHPHPTINKVLLFSQTNKFEDVLQAACQALNKSFDNSRIWIKTKNTWIVPNLVDTLEKIKVMDEEILLETLIMDKTKNYWPRDVYKDKIVSFPSNNLTASSSNSEDSKRSDRKKTVYTRAAKFPGVVGLMNLGNTCYFNCIIQALVHTPLLQEFFATSNINSFMNRNYNIDESLSNELSLLSKEIWEANNYRLNPIRLFKLFTKRFDMFEDKEQHDCHEFLSMILDSLHEELRREGNEGKSTIIIENPENKQVEIIESDRQWQLLQGTQGSIITDICAGQTKTTLSCTSCNSKRILFEIFTNLSLPIPIINSIPLYIIVVPLLSPITKFAVLISKYLKISDLLQKISTYSSIPIENLMLIEAVLNNNITILENHPHITLSNLGIHSKAELVAFEIRKTVEECEKLGRRALAYNSKIQIGEQIDIFSGESWVTGKLIDIKRKFIPEYIVEYDYKSITESRSLSQISEFRKNTSSFNCRPVTFILFHISSNGSRKALGFPMILSIGNWYTFEDLHNLATENCMRMASKDIKSTTNDFKLLILDPVSLTCGLCKGYSGCNGCPLLKNKTEVKVLGQNMRRICIAADWNENHYSAEIKYDSSVIQIKEKEKEISKTIDINTCLDAFTKEEKLEMECEKCKNKSMNMVMEIWRAPDILILSLKRFTYSNGVAEKIDSLVYYPFFSFDISAYVKSIEPPQKLSLSTFASMNSYDLYAVVLHSGNIYGGHYTTLIKMETSSPWILFDDDSTLELKESPENSSILSNSYLLFYRRRRFSSSNVINLTYNSI